MTEYEYSGKVPPSRQLARRMHDPHNIWLPSKSLLDHASVVGREKCCFIVVCDKQTLEQSLSCIWSKTHSSSVIRYTSHITHPKTKLMAMEIENIDSNLSNAMENEAHIEQLLSEKLMEGYVLLEKSCPVCSTPLVKNQASDEDDEDDEEPVEKDVEPVLIPRGSFIEPFKPVQGVPFCVGCSSHVVTQECEISVLEKCHSLKGKGGIFVAITRSKDNSATGTGTGTETNTNPSTDPSTDPSASTIAELEEAPQVEVVDVIEEVQEDDTVHEIIDVTKLEESSSMSHHVEEKKEEEEIVQQDDTDVAVMVDYSVR